MKLIDCANEGTTYPVPLDTWAALIASFDNDSSTYASFEPLDVTTQDSTATAWADGIGAADLASAGSPVHDSTPGEVIFDGTDDVFTDAINFGTGTTAFGLAIRFRCDAAAVDRSPINLSDDAVTTAGRCSLYIPSTLDSVSVIWRSDAASDITNTIATGALGLGEHVAFITCDGAGNGSIRVDGSALDTGSTAGPMTLTRLTIGCLQHAASQFYFHDGGVSHLAYVIGREWTTQEMDDMVAFSF